MPRAMQSAVSPFRTSTVFGNGAAWRMRCGAYAVTLLSPSSAALEEVHMALEEYRSAGYQLGITALYILLCPALLSNSKRDAALDLIGSRTDDGQPQFRTDIRSRNCIG